MLRSLVGSEMCIRDRSYEKPTTNDDLNYGKLIIKQELLRIEESEKSLEGFPRFKTSILTLDRLRKISRRTLPKKRPANPVDQVTVILKSAEDIDLSPCKVVKKNNFKAGGLNIYTCAPREEQMNRFRNLECRTIHRKAIVSVNRPTKKYAIDNFPDGCELRFKKSKKNCNQLRFTNNKGC